MPGGRGRELRDRRTKRRRWASAGLCASFARPFKQTSGRKLADGKSVISSEDYIGLPLSMASCAAAVRASQAQAFRLCTPKFGSALPEGAALKDNCALLAAFGAALSLFLFSKAPRVDDCIQQDP